MDFLIGAYPWIKALHLLAVIAWFAGLMYLPRLFVYHHQSEKGGEAEGFFTAMERRLLKGIMNPSMIVVWVLGLVMLAIVPQHAGQIWLWVKIVAVLGISGIHGFYAKSYRQFEQGERPRTEKFWRIMNEVPFILLIIVVIMVIVVNPAG